MALQTQKQGAVRAKTDILSLFLSIANCIMTAQFPVENHSAPERFAELPLKTIGKVQVLGDYYAICSKSFPQ
jgi:hypothetical protein